MRVKAATVQKFLLGLALLAALAWNLAHASEIKGLQLSNGPTGTRAEIALDGAGEYKVISLKGPDRLVVDLPTVKSTAGLRMPAGTGVVKSVRTGQPSPGTTRIVFDLTQSVTALKPRIEQSATGARLVLEWPGDGPVAQSTQAPAPVIAAAPAVALPTEAPRAAAGVEDDKKFETAASSAATTRLISELVARNTATAAPAATNTAPATTNSAPAATPAQVQARTVPVAS